MTCVFLCLSPPYSLKQGFSVESRAHRFATHDGQLDPDRVPYLCTLKPEISRRSLHPASIYLGVQSPCLSDKTAWPPLFSVLPPLCPAYKSEQTGYPHCSCCTDNLQLSQVINTPFRVATLSFRIPSWRIRENISKHPSFPEQACVPWHQDQNFSNNRLILSRNFCSTKPGSASGSLPAVPPANFSSTSIHFLLEKYLLLPDPCFQFTKHVYNISEPQMQTWLENLPL